MKKDFYVIQKLITNLTKRLSNYVIQNITKRYFWKYKIYGGRRRKYGSAGRNSLFKIHILKKKTIF